MLNYEHGNLKKKSLKKISEISFALKNPVEGKSW